MGIYVQTPVTTGKAQYLIEKFGATKLPGPTYLPAELGGPVAICVVENGIFDAAAVVYSENEKIAFSAADDLRYKTWLSVSRDRIKELVPVEQWERAGFSGH